MKKSILFIVVVIACFAMTAPAVFAVDTFTTSHSTVLGSVVFTPSTNVSVNSVATGKLATNPNQYCVTAWHGSSVNQTSGLQYAAISGGGTGNQNTAIVTKTLQGVQVGSIPLCTVETTLPSGF
jgi:hypothetical protein